MGSISPETTQIPVVTDEWQQLNSTRPAWLFSVDLHIATAQARPRSLVDRGIRVAGNRYRTMITTLQAHSKQAEEAGNNKLDASYRPALLRIIFDMVNSHPDPVGVLIFFTPPPARYTGGGALGRNRLPAEQKRT